MMTCAFCPKRKTRFCGSNRTAPLQLPWYERVSAKCMRRHRKAHGFTRQKLRGLLRFHKNALV